MDDIIDALTEAIENGEITEQEARDELWWAMLGLEDER